MTGVSRDLVRAVLGVRDRRHHETHAALLALFQALTTELLDAGAIRAEPLRERIEQALAGTTTEPHAVAARDLLSHVVQWLRTVQPDLPAPNPTPWAGPGFSAGSGTPER
jgi:hypothetical protein